MAPAAISWKSVRMAPLTRAAAEQIAADHVSQASSGHPAYRVGYQLTGRIGDQWLFEYEIDCATNIPVENQEQFAGAGGFLVSAGGSIRIVSVPELIELEQRLSESADEL